MYTVHVNSWFDAPTFVRHTNYFIIFDIFANSSRATKMV